LKPFGTRWSRGLLAALAVLALALAAWLGAGAVLADVPRPNAAHGPFALPPTPEAPHPQPEGWVAGKTSVSDLSRDERARMLGIPAEVEEWEKAQRSLSAPQDITAYTYPPSLDWRSVNGQDWTTPIRNQSQCGSCVAFGTLGAIESRLEIANGNPSLNPNLSEAHLFYCGCGTCCAVGWYPSAALDFAATIGIVDEACYPYAPYDQACIPCSGWQTRVSKIAGWTGRFQMDDIKQAIADGGPVVATMTVYEDFYSYVSGVYRHTWGDYLGGHAVTLVGYNDAEGYWIVRNSWSAGWGESGWFRIAYGQCGIDDYIYAPNMLPVGATATPAPASTSTPTRTRTPTRTATRTWTPAGTSTYTFTATRTATATPTRTATNTRTPTRTRTPAPTATATPTRMPTRTATRTRTPTGTPGPTQTPTPAPPLHAVRFTAQYVSGYNLTYSVYYALDGGSPQFLSTVANSGDWTFSARFNSIRVYINVGQTLYSQNLYVDGALVSCGTAGSAGLIWPGGTCSAPASPTPSPSRTNTPTRTLTATRTFTPTRTATRTRTPTLPPTQTPTPAPAPPSHAVRFAAQYATGYMLTRSVYYIADGGSPVFLGTVTRYAAYTFTANFNTVRVYVNTSAGNTYYEELYVDGALVACGTVASEGLTWPSGSCP